MATLIVCSSREHGNTRKIADALADVLACEIAAPVSVDAGAVAAADLVGFGSGIRFGRHYADLLELVDRLPQQAKKRAFIFSTSGFGWRSWHRALRRKLRARGFVVKHELACKGLDTVGALRLIGGVNKGRPNERDLAAARAFARSLT